MPHLVAKCIFYPIPIPVMMHAPPIPQSPVNRFKIKIFVFFPRLHLKIHSLMCKHTTHHPPRHVLPSPVYFFFSGGRGTDAIGSFLTSQSASRHQLQQRQQDKKGTTKTSTRCQYTPPLPRQHRSHTSPPRPKKPLRPAEDSPSFTMLSASPTCLRVVTSRRARGVLRCICL